MSWIYFTYIYTTSSSLRVDNCYFILCTICIEYIMCIVHCTIWISFIEINLTRFKFEKYYIIHIGNELAIDWLTDWLIDWLMYETRKKIEREIFEHQIHTFRLALILWFSNQQQNKNTERNICTISLMHKHAIVVLLFVFPLSLSSFDAKGIFYK